MFTMIDRYKTPYELKPGVWVFPTTDAGRELGRDILCRVLQKWYPPAHFYHFQEGGHVKALHDHLESDFFAVADIKSFFQSTTRSMLVKALVKIGFNFTDALDIATNSTVKHFDLGERRFIPHGFVQSALLASLCLERSKLGSVIRRALGSALTVTVYMDDIILSCKTSGRVSLERIYAELLEVMESRPYEMNAAKMQPPAASAKVFNVMLSHGAITVLDERMDDFRNALREYESDNAVNAVINYVDGLNQRQALELSAYAAQQN